MTDWIHSLKDISRDVDFFPAATEEAIAAARAVLGPLPPALEGVLRVTNGLVCRSFRLLSVFDSAYPKKTWESLQRANTAEKTDALGGSAAMLRRFLVIANIGNGFAALEKALPESVWYEELDGPLLHATHLDLRAFIELMVEKAE